MALESIALIPSGYKANKLYCQLPVDGGADLTTSRASGATRVNKNGLIESVAVDVPRLDYLDGGCPSLLLEPASTNLFTYSEDFSNVAWSKSASGTGIAPVVTVNQGLSPDGSVNADRVVFDLNGGTTSSAISQLFDGVTGTASIDYHLSIYIKSFDGSNYQLELADVNGADKLLITVTSEWQRFDLSTNNATTVKGLNLRLKGDTTSQTADVLIWGAQVEEQSYPTSYIRTNGSSVTRIADAVTGNSSLGQVINSSEGVLYAEVAYFDKDTEQNSITLSDASISNRLTFRRMTTGQLGVVVASGGGSVFSNSSIIALNSNEFYKIAFKYKSGDYAVWLNGVEVLTNTSTTLPLNLSKLELGQGGGSFDNLYGRLKELKVYDTALTDAELTTLTTL